MHSAVCVEVILLGLAALNEKGFWQEDWKRYFVPPCWRVWLPVTKAGGGLAPRRAAAPGEGLEVQMLD